MHTVRDNADDESPRTPTTKPISMSPTESPDPLQPDGDGEYRIAPHDGAYGVAHATNATNANSATEVAKRALFIPRGLVMLAALWVFLSWMLLFGPRPPVQPQAASYGPSLQLLFTSIGVGAAIGWPLLRLAGRPSGAPVRQAIFDSLAVFLLLQVVAWPLRLVSAWSMDRSWLVIASLGASILCTGAMLAIWQGSTSRKVRTRVMVAAVAAVLLPHAIAIAGELVAPTASRDFADQPDDTSGTSWRRLIDVTAPLSGPTLLYRAAEPVPLATTAEEWAPVRIAASLGGMLWCAAFVVGLRRRARGVRPDPPLPLSYER